MIIISIEIAILKQYCSKDSSNNTSQSEHPNLIVKLRYTKHHIEAYVSGLFTCFHCQLVAFPK